MAAISVVSKLNTFDRILKAKRVDRPSMPSITPAASRYSWMDLALGSVSLMLWPSYTFILEKMLEFSGSLIRDNTENWASISRVSGAQGAPDSELCFSSLR